MDKTMAEDDIQSLVDQITNVKPTKVMFVGREINMRPASIAVMKKLRNATAQFEVGFTKIPEDELRDPMRNAERELQVADLLVASVKDLLDWYKIPITSAELMETCSIGELELFLKTQIELNRDEDFLSRPLKNIIAIYSERQKSVPTQSS